MSIFLLPETNMQETYPNDYIDHVRYGIKNVLSFKWIILFFLVFLIGFLLTFPIKEKIHSTLSTALSQNPSCPISFDNIEYHLLPPSIELKKINIPSRCSDRTLKDLTIPTATLAFGGVSFSPIGPVVSLKVGLLSEPILAKLVLGITEQVIKIDNNNVDLKELVSYLNEPYLVSGNINLNARLILKNNTLNQGEIRVQSQDLLIPAQSIKGGFELPVMDLQVLDLIAEIPEGGSQYNISTLNIGAPESAIRLKGTGTILPQTNGIKLELELAPSQDFLNEFLILETLLQSYNKKDGFYRIKVEGNMNAPTIKSF